MKQILLLIILFVFSIANAQNTGAVIPFDTKKAKVIDTAKLVVSYELDFLPDSAKKNVVLTNNLSLFVGNNYSMFINSQYIHVDEKQKKAPKGSGHLIEGRGLAATIIYKNKKANKMEVNVKLADHNTYCYEENIPKQNWKILNERKDILGYPCQAASTTYLGRIYTAWFAPTIPVQEGPWKFSGLPGLILEVADSREHYVFKCVGIEQVKQQKAINRYEIKCVDTNRKKLNSYIKNLHENYATVLEAQGMHAAFFTPDGKEIDNKKISYPYNPIELE